MFNPLTDYKYNCKIIILSKNIWFFTKGTLCINKWYCQDNKEWLNQLWHGLMLLRKIGFLKKYILLKIKEASKTNSINTCSWYLQKLKKNLKIAYVQVISILPQKEYWTLSNYIIFRPWDQKSSNLIIHLCLNAFPNISAKQLSRLSQNVSLFLWPES